MFDKVYQFDMITHNLYFQGPLIVCLTEMLRMMDDNNYDSLLVVRRGSELKVSGNCC